jgi:Pro-kumamolisin, activation domain/HYDIN/CFA65/VesB-like, Ig-like domain/Cep192 domain 4
MSFGRVVMCCAVLLAAMVAYEQIAPVDAGSGPRALITQKIDEAALVKLADNTRPEANAANDRGPATPDFPMEHMLLQLRRPPEQEQAFEEYLGELQDPKSPNYHHWLTAAEIGNRYGLAAQDLATITGWLKSQGFTVNEVYPNGTLIDFSGTAGQVHRAFHTEIDHLDVNGKPHTANMSDPEIPAALAPAIVGVVSLSDFRPRPQNVARPNYSVTFSGVPYYLLVPADLATIYNLNPLFSAGYSGQGQTIVVVEDSNLYKTSDWTTFRSKFGLASAYPHGSLSQVHPGGCTNPGVNADDSEAEIDAEWASAGAPSAAIKVASCRSTSATFGGFIAMENLLSSGIPPAIMSVGYGDSESDLGAAGNAYINSLYQQAAGEGVSVFVAAGDQGAASSDFDASAATHGINVNGFASTPYDVAVGGTDFSDTYAGTNDTYWNSRNGTDYGSARSYVPEIPWNDSCASGLLATYLGYATTYGSAGLCNSSDAVSNELLDVVGGGGGPSGCATGTPGSTDVVSGSCQGYPKPSWQSVFGIPDDGVRDLPDVSLFAGDGIWGHYYVVCYSDPASGYYGYPCTGAPSNWAGFGGTSFGAPIMGAIQALVNQRAGGRQGNPNPAYYSLAATEYGSGGSASCDSSLGNRADSSCIFYDVTQGDMDVPCTGTHNCYKPSGTYGVLSTSNSAYQPAYGTDTGWDFATGIGTVNAYNLAMAFPAIQPTPEARLKFSPKHLHFGTEKELGGLGKSSAPLYLKLKNPKNRKQDVTIALTSISVTGDFKEDAQDTDCGPTLAPRTKCKVAVVFSPTGPGVRTGTLTVTSNAALSPIISVPLKGKGRQGKLKFRPKSHDFGKEPVNSTTGSKTVKLFNKNPVAMDLAVGVSGPFTIVNNCPSSLPAGGTCEIEVAFAPTISGKVQGALTFTDTAVNSPQSVKLKGTGQ